MKTICKISGVELDASEYSVYDNYVECMEALKFQLNEGRSKHAALLEQVKDYEQCLKYIAETGWGHDSEDEIVNETKAVLAKYGALK
jgi:hypothetical protein